MRTTSESTFGRGWNSAGLTESRGDTSAQAASSTVGTPYSLVPGWAISRRATSFWSMTTAESISSARSINRNRKGVEIE